MRNLIVTLFLITSAVASAQRPWSLCMPMSVGPQPVVTTAASSVFVFDTAAMRTFDHGVTWEQVSGYSGKLCGITDFTAGLTLLASYTPLDRKVHMYFSIGGAAWTSFYEFEAPASGRPIGLTASATEWFIAFENSNQICVYGDTLDRVALPTGTTVVDIKYWQGNLLALDPQQGLFVSADKGKTWRLTPAKGGRVIHASAMGVYLATDDGVASIDVDARKASPVGVWPGRTTPPRVSDVDSYISALYAYSDDGSFQLYRLLGQNWEPTGYPLPGSKATRTSSVLAIDAGYAILAHAVTEGYTDSAGVYVYDLNDFTSIDNHELPNTLQPRVVGDLVHLTSKTDATRPIEIWSLRGELVCVIPIQGDIAVIPAVVRGMYVVRVHRRDSNVPWNILMSR